ncbi:MAG: FtsX-like permease family protein, partial [Candidatus Kariarchaeaceae archaeon]
MGKLRVFRRSVRFTFRTKKRFYVFLLIFAIISSFVAFFIDSLDDLQTDRFMEQKGVIVRQDGDYQVTYNQGQSLLTSILALPASNPDVKIEGHVVYNYIDLDGFLRIYSIDISKPWFSDFAKPSLITSGSYPSKSSEVLVPSGSFQQRNSTVPGITVKSKVVVGQKLVYEKAGSEPLELKVSGTFETSQLQTEPDKADRLWLFMDTKKFNEVVTFFGNTTSDAFTYSMSFSVEGNVIFFNSGTHDNVKLLNEEIKSLIAEGSPSTYGDWESQPESLPSEQAEREGLQTMVNLGFVIIGGIVLSTMFAYLISRFRRREVAILKAMGYSHWSVRTSLVAEIITLAFTGFIVGVTLAQGLLYYASDFNRHSLLRWQALGVSFLINVVISLPGMLLV